MNLKTRKGVDLGVKLPWFISWLFQFIDLVVLPLSLSSWPRRTRSGREAGQQLPHWGGVGWELCTQILAPRKCSGETVSDSGLLFF